MFYMFYTINIYIYSVYINIRNIYIYMRTYIYFYIHEYAYIQMYFAFRTALCLQDFVNSNNVYV